MGCVCAKPARERWYVVEASAGAAALPHVLSGEAQDRVFRLWEEQAAQGVAPPRRMGPIAAELMDACEVADAREQADGRGTAGREDVLGFESKWEKDREKAAAQERFDRRAVSLRILSYAARVCDAERLTDDAAARVVGHAISRDRREQAQLVFNLVDQPRLGYLTPQTLGSTLFAMNAKRPNKAAKQKAREDEVEQAYARWNEVATMLVDEGHGNKLTRPEFLDMSSSIWNIIASSEVVTELDSKDWAGWLEQNRRRLERRQSAGRAETGPDQEWSQWVSAIESPRAAGARRRREQQLKQARNGEGEGVGSPAPGEAHDPTPPPPVRAFEDPAPDDLSPPAAAPGSPRSPHGESALARKQWEAQELAKIAAAPPSAALPGSRPAPPPAAPAAGRAAAAPAAAAQSPQLGLFTGADPARGPAPQRPLSATPRLASTTATGSTDLPSGSTRSSALAPDGSPSSGLGHSTSQRLGARAPAGSTPSGQSLNASGVLLGTSGAARSPPAPGSGSLSLSQSHTRKRPASANPMGSSPQDPPARGGGTDRLASSQLAAPIMGDGGRHGKRKSAIELAAESNKGKKANPGADAVQKALSAEQSVSGRSDGGAQHGLRMRQRQKEANSVQISAGGALVPQ